MANQAAHTQGEELSRDFLAKFTKPELATFVRMTYGLNLHPDQHSRDEMIKIVMETARKYKGNADFNVVAQGEEVEVPKGFVKIRVNPGQYNPGERPIPIGLNFVTATVPVNVDVVMPGKWLTCLQDAVETRYAVVRNHANNRDELTSSEQHKYPYTLLVDNR